MTKLITLSVCILFGYGIAKAQTREVTTASYDKIEISGSFKVNLVEGKEGKITIVGEDIERLLSVKTDGDILKIQNEKKFKWKNNTQNTIVITIPYENISGISLSGSGSISADAILKSDSFTTELSGSGKISAAFQVKKFTGSLNGSGRMNLSGKAEIAAIQITGSGSIDGDDLETLETKANVTGSGTCKVHCTEKLVASINGSGTIFYSGNPKIDDAKINGSGKVKKR